MNHPDQTGPNRTKQWFLDAIQECHDEYRDYDVNNTDAIADLEAELNLQHPQH